MSRRPVEPLAMPFSWLPAVLNGNSEALLIADVMDAWRGVETCLELVNSSQLDRSHNENTDAAESVSVLLSICDTERLMRLALVTAKTWSLKCENHLSRMEEHAKGQERGGAK